MKKFIPLITIMLVSSTIFSQTAKQINNKLYDLFGVYEGCFVLYDLNNSIYYRHNDKICNTRYSPMSTFKVPNSIIALELGVLKDENSVIKWDSIKNPAKDSWHNLKWDRDQTLQTAFERSVVWYYQDIARKIGKDNYRDYLEKFKYGNQTIGDKVDLFWLDGSLEISANEQIEFLRGFYKNKYGLSKESINTVKKIFNREKTEKYILSYKTGGGDISENLFIGWLVGYVEKEGNVYFFAMNIFGSDFDTIAKKRMDISLGFLRYLNLID